MTTITVESRDLGKATVVLACAMTLTAINGVPVESQTFAQADDQSAVTECVVEVSPSDEGAEVGLPEKAVEWAQFQALVKQWRDERPATSSVAQMASSFAYSQIIGMGPDVVPMILAQLKSEGTSPNHWFWALASITRDNPVPKESRGKLQEMAKAWLAWGEAEGYV